MPKIEVPTAQGKNQVGLRQFGVLNLPTPTDEAYGSGIGKGMQQLSQALFAVDQRLQDQRDRIDLSRMSLEFSTRLDEAKHKVLTDPSIPFENKPKMLADHAQNILTEVAELGQSSNSKTAFQAWATGKFGEARMEVVHEGRAVEAQNQLNTGTKINEDSLDRAAKMPLTGAGNRFREVMERVAEVKDRLNAEVQNGLRRPADAKKEEKRLLNRYWEQRAQNDPMTIIGLAGTGTQVPDMDMEQMGHYLDIAHAVQTKIRVEQDREQKAIQQEVIKGIEGIMWGGEGGLQVGRDATTEIESQKGILTGEQYSHLLEDNKKLRDLRWEITPDRKRLSEFTKVDLLELAKRAKYEPKLLDHTINNAIVRDHVFKKKDLLPDDAAPILSAISEAIGHQESGESSTRRAQTEAMHSLNVFVPQSMEPMQALSLKNVEDGMKREFRAELERNPDATPTEIQDIADNIRARGEKRIVGLQKLNLKQVDEELLGMEQLWKGFSPNIVNEKHIIDEKTRKQVEQQFPLMRGLFRLHDERRLRWEQLQAAGQDVAAEGEPKRGKRKP